MIVPVEGARVENYKMGAQFAANKPQLAVVAQRILAGKFSEESAITLLRNHEIQFKSCRAAGGGACRQVFFTIAAQWVANEDIIISKSQLMIATKRSTAAELTEISSSALDKKLVQTPEVTCRLFPTQCCNFRLYPCQLPIPESKPSFNK